ncbi:MAG: preprotein translocase subunit SecE [Clostridiales bacterium]|nr:preprotein translocase subunit SecE [Clostridiales bacterium]
MGETANNTTEKAPRRSWFKGIKAEFQKIIWPDKDSLIKQTIAVISVTIALGLIIMVLDFAIEQLIAFLL